MDDSLGLLPALLPEVLPEAFPDLPAPLPLGVGGPERLGVALPGLRDRGAMAELPPVPPMDGRVDELDPPDDGGLPELCCVAAQIVGWELRKQVLGVDTQIKMIAV